MFVFSIQEYYILLGCYARSQIGLSRSNSTLLILKQWNLTAQFTLSIKPH